MNLKLQFCRAKCLYKNTRNAMKGIKIMKDLYRQNTQTLLGRTTSLQMKNVSIQGRRLDV